ncbi:MAG: hypothetical protein HY713_08560 [candidate division NC10 bacterium]|nr:hypothetical protein [candidate division NC10 bacterium]
MSNPEDPPSSDDVEFPAFTGPERRSGLERRQSRKPQPPPGQTERRQSVRRRSDRLAAEGIIRIGMPGLGERLYRRVQIEVPVICRPLRASPPSGKAVRRGMTFTLAPGGLGMLLDEEFSVDTHLEVLVRFEGDLLAADVRVVSVISHGGRLLHNCRFTRLGTADRNWLTEYLRVRDAPSF